MNLTANTVAPELASRIAAFFKPADDAQRARRVSRVRRSVRAESYENELKLSIAVDRLIEDLEGRPMARASS